MKEFLKEIYYYFLYGQLFGRGYDGMKKLNILLIYLEDVGIKSISKLNGHYDLEIIFNDNSRFECRCSESRSIRWYSFMRYGKIEFSNGKILIWDSNMPSYEILYKYKKIIIEKMEDTDDYTEYLPTRVLRKLKLKKISN